MSGLDQVASDFARAQAQLTRSIGEAVGWKDDQRARLERGRIDPLLGAADVYSSALRDALAAVATAERLLDR